MFGMVKKIADAVDERLEFSRRLNELCDQAQIPPKGKNRQSIVGRLFGASQKGARKWLEGYGLPTGEKIIKMAKYFGVCTEWLWSGRGPKYLSGAYEPEIYELAEKLHKEGWRRPQAPPKSQ